MTSTKNLSIAVLLLSFFWISPAMSANTNLTDTGSEASASNVQVAAATSTPVIVSSTPGSTTKKPDAAATTVPLPALFWLFGSALIGFIAFSGRTTV